MWVRGSIPVSERIAHTHSYVATSAKCTRVHDLFFVVFVVIVVQKDHKDHRDYSDYNDYSDTRDRLQFILNDVVTQMTITDKLRNLSHDIEGS